MFEVGDSSNLGFLLSRLSCCSSSILPVVNKPAAAAAAVVVADALHPIDVVSVAFLLRTGGSAALRKTRW